MKRRAAWNEEQYAVLMKGAAAWNEWRATNSGLIDLPQAPFDRADLSGAWLVRARLIGTSFNGSVLAAAHLDSADLSSAQMEAADMRKVSAVDASFRDAGLRGANLEEAMLHEANLSWADLTGANLSGARLDHAILRASNLSGADLTGAVFYGTVLSYVDLRTVRGLDAVNHRGPSTIGLDTITRSGGDIPESFLRGAGVPDSTIAYARSIAAKPGQFYSCFISYSTKDERLAKRLYTDLQSRGVRCWFAPEDLKIGDRFRHRIDEAIRVHDKLLLLLSESSIASTWVESEVEAAFEKEQKSGKLVLFPVRLDDAVMNSTAAWAADIRRKRQIGEFQGWEHADTYERAFARLLRDLGVEGA